MKIFKKINEVFINILLFIFYFLIIGVAKIMYFLFRKKEKSKKTFWNKPEEKPLDVYSPY
jgi:hypothetical protein